MADFCYDCTAHLFGLDLATRNDLDMTGRGDFEYIGLCECCGWGYFDEHGKRRRDLIPIETECECDDYPCPLPGDLRTEQEPGLVFRAFDDAGGLLDPTAGP